MAGSYERARGGGGTLSVCWQLPNSGRSLLVVLRSDVARPGEGAQPSVCVKHPRSPAACRRAAACCLEPLRQGWDCPPTKLGLPLCPSIGQVPRALCILLRGMLATALRGPCLHPHLQTESGSERVRHWPGGAQVGGCGARFEPLSHCRTLSALSSCPFLNSFWVAIKNRIKCLTTQWSPALRLSLRQHEGI